MPSTPRSSKQRPLILLVLTMVILLLTGFRPIHDQLPVLTPPPTPAVPSTRPLAPPTRVHTDDPAMRFAHPDQWPSPQPAAPATTSPLVCDGNGISGNRIEAIYAYATDRPDRYDQYLGVIHTAIAEADAFIQAGAAETGGRRRLRLVTDQTCAPAVRKVALSPTGVDSKLPMVDELTAQGFARTDRKYLVFLDAEIPECESIGRQLDSRHGAANANNQGPAYARLGFFCWRGDIVAHELLHGLGAVQIATPNNDNDGHTFDQGDIMGWTNVGMPIQNLCPASPYLDRLMERLDCNHDDYFHTNPLPGSFLATRWNIADSAFLVAEPTAPLPPLPLPDATASEQLGGSLEAVAAAGSLVYLGVGSRLIVLDVSTPRIPRLVGQSAPLPGIIRDLTVAGRYVYAATEGDGLRILDLVDPAHPVVIGWLDTPGWATAVTVVGPYAYVADGSGGLRIIDVSIPQQPREQGSVQSIGWASGVTISGTFAYLADGDNGLLEIDITDPTAPREMRQQWAGMAYEDVVVAWPYAYVSDRAGGLQTFDLVGSPSSPGMTMIGGYSAVGQARRFTVVGSSAYVAWGAAGLRILDLTTPINPTLLGTYDTAGVIQDVAVVGTRAYVADRWTGLHIVDITDRQHPAVLGQYDLAGYASATVVQNGYAYVVDTGRLRTLDRSDPAHPRDIGLYALPGWDTPDSSWITTVAVTGTKAIVGHTYGVGVVNITDPTHPTTAWVAPRDPQTSGAIDIALAGSYAYVANQTAGLEILDISSPITPTHLISVKTPKPTTAIAVVGKYAYITAGTAGVILLDVTQPLTPTVVGTYDTPGSAYDIAVRGSYAFVADGGSGLCILTLADPAPPTMVGRLDTPGTARSVALHDQVAYVADEGYGVHGVDVSNPQALRNVQWYRTPGYAIQLTVAGSDLYIADGWGGLSVRPATLKTTTTTQLQSSANPAMVGQKVLITATVLAGSPGSDTPSGAVTFKNGAQMLGVVSVQNGRASLSLAGLGQGIYTLTASYSGDASFTPSNAPALTQRVEPSRVYLATLMRS
jgi:hypothetical protein